MVNKRDLRAGVASMRKTAAFLQQWADDLESSLEKKPGKGTDVVDDEAAAEPAAVAEGSGAAAAPELTLGDNLKQRDGPCVSH